MLTTLLSQDRNRNSVRSSQMIQQLRNNLFYSDKRTRDALFAAADHILSSGPPVMLSRLTREAAEFAQAHRLTTVREPVNWEMSAKAVFNSMLYAGVLLDQSGNAVRPHIQAQASEIKALSPSYADTTEAFLVQFLIRKLGDVTIRDHKALAHALFRQFDPNITLGDLEDRVVRLIATLSNSITLTEDGTYVAVSAAEPQ